MLCRVGPWVAPEQTPISLRVTGDAAIVENEKLRFAQQGYQLWGAVTGASIAASPYGLACVRAISRQRMAGSSRMNDDQFIHDEWRTRYTPVRRLVPV